MGRAHLSWSPSPPSHPLDDAPPSRRTVSSQLLVQSPARMALARVRAQEQRLSNHPVLSASTALSGPLGPSQVQCPWG